LICGTTIVNRQQYKLGFYVKKVDNSGDKPKEEGGSRHESEENLYRRVVLRFFIILGRPPLTHIPHLLYSPDLIIQSTPSSRDLILSTHDIIHDIMTYQAWPTFTPTDPHSLCVSETHVIHAPSMHHRYWHASLIIIH
jgi:hypothetical protein